MRPIKFRAWDKKNRELFILTLDDLMAGEYRLYRPEYEVAQFTGLLDKNGKEIWEGDFLMFDYPMEVFWDMGSWTVRTKLGPSLLYGYTNEGEVIGNIYENPELLKEVDI